MKLDILGRLVELSTEKTYSLPDDIVPKHVDGFLLLVSPSNGNWIVVDNQLQADIVKAFISGQSIEKVIRNFNLDEVNSDLQYILRQIEGKRFTETILPDEESFVLRLYVTNKCDLRCKHCFMYAGEQAGNELSLQEIQDIIRTSKNGGCSKVILSGGEVSTRTDLAEIIKYAKGQGLYVQLMTNGYGWKKETINEIAPYIDEVQISVDGYNEEINSLIRGKGVFERALQSLDWFYEHTNVFTNIVITPLYGFLDKYVQEYIDFGKHLIDKYDPNRFLLIINSELIDGRTVKADKAKNIIMQQAADRIYEEIYPNSKLTTFVANHFKNRIYRNCGYGSLTVAANGDYYFCGRIFDVKCYGNVRNEDFQSVLKKRKLAREKSYVDHLEPCSRCELKYICGGGCRVANFPEVVEMDLEQKETAVTRSNVCTELDKLEIYRNMINGNDFLY